MKSIDNIDDKLLEADYFFEKIKEQEAKLNLFTFKCYFNAFLSSARSITFSLRANGSDLEGFEEWYEGQQTVLAENKLARIFLLSRNEAEKVGVNHLSGGVCDETGHRVYVSLPSSQSGKKRVEVLAVESAQSYLKCLVKIISNFYKD